MVNDKETTVLLSRAEVARAAGWDSNVYACHLCILDGYSAPQTVYLDWPMYFMFGQPICDLHAEHGLQRR